MSRHPTRTLLTAAVLLSLQSGCVKKSEYDALQVENQALQTRVDQANHLLVQSQTDLSAAQVQMQQFLVVQTRLQKAEQELKLSQDEVSALKARFEQFRTQRRSAMVGRKFPTLSLEDGRVLSQVEITAVNAEEVSFRHSAGLAKVALAKTTPDLRWEACYDPQEALEKARENKLVKTVKDQGSPPVTPAPSAATPPPARNAVDVLRAQLASQRQLLNSEYQALAAKNGTALRGAEWNSAQPENSPLLSTLSGSRAVLGISRLQAQRNAILTTLQQLRELDPAAR
ncbi:hypothetical protein [Prosthecobacter sp.]|uniref:hypothetical protein n=1 Tax=Prosthecobacter sp. TaxID=1965333 RepID=UPI003782D961